MLHISSISKLALTLTLGFIFVLANIGMSHGQDLGDLFRIIRGIGSGSLIRPARPLPPKGGMGQGPQVVPAVYHPLPTVGYYEGKCRSKYSKIDIDVEALVETEVVEEFRKNPSILPALLRLQFHDCFVNGCDASILVAGNETERNADPNLTVRGYEFIDSLKALLEEQCPDIVSCADIIAIATKVVIKLGGGPNYAVETGRLDGVRSNKSDVDLPSPFMSVSDCAQVFIKNGFTIQEMVALLGSHSVGTAHCGFFQDRLYNDTGAFDPNMDENLRSQLKGTCPQDRTSNNLAFLDQNQTSSNIVDNSFYGQLRMNRGILPIDQALPRDPLTSGIVSQLATNPGLFSQQFGDAMIHLQRFKVTTDPKKGNIRKVCSKFN